MLRTATKPRLLRLFVVMLVLVAAFVWLGNWQWRVAHNKANEKVLQSSSVRAVEPLDDVLKPQTQFENERSLQPVRVTGRYDAGKTELVADRVLDGAHGWWLMTPLVTDSTGARIPVVRGFVTTTSGLPKPPTGAVTIEGSVAPGESVSTSGDLPAGQIGTIDMGTLLNEWGGRVYNGFIFSTKQTPPDTRGAATATVRHIPPPVPKTTKIDWRNAAYAWQWWIFAAFAVFMWWRQVRDEYAQDQADAQVAHADLSDDDGHDGESDGDSNHDGAHDAVGRYSDPKAGDDVVGPTHDQRPANTSTTREDPV